MTIVVRRCEVAFASIFTCFIVAYFGIKTLARQEKIQMRISIRDWYLIRELEAAEVRLSLEKKFMHSGLIWIGFGSPTHLANVQAEKIFNLVFYALKLVCGLVLLVYTATQGIVARSLCLF